jgi:transposase
MPALNAIRLNPEFKAKYEAMVKAGKPAKVAIVAIMRKLVILANALIRDQRKWAASGTTAVPAIAVIPMQAGNRLQRP